MGNVQKMRSLLFFITICGAFLTGCTKEDKLVEDLVRVGDKLPAFTVVMEDGSTFNSAVLSGKPLVLTFFTTTCTDCQRTLPIVQQAYENFSDVTFISISRAEEKGSIRNYWNTNGLTLPFSAQKDRKVYNLFATSRIPRIYIVKSDGIVSSFFTDNPTPDYQTLSAAISKVCNSNK